MVQMLLPLRGAIVEAEIGIRLGVNVRSWQSANDSGR